MYDGLPRLQPGQQGVELQNRIQLPQHLVIPWPCPELIQLQLDGHVASDSHQLTTQAGIVSFRQERLSRALRPYLPGTLQDAVEVAVRVDQLPRCLITDAANSRDVVRRITH